MLYNLKLLPPTSLCAGYWCSVSVFTIHKSLCWISCISDFPQFVLNPLLPNKHIHCIKQIYESFFFLYCFVPARSKYSLLNTIFSNTLSFLSSLNVSDQASHPYKTCLLLLLLWCFGPSSGHSFPVASVLRLTSVYSWGCQSHEESPNLEGRGVCLRHLTQNMSGLEGPTSA